MVLKVLVAFTELTSLGLAATVEADVWNLQTPPQKFFCSGK
jgi:hypothetical protein